MIRRCPRPGTDRTGSCAGERVTRALNRHGECCASGCPDFNPASDPHAASPADLKWSGRILDPNTGSTYDSTFALTGSDTLRVQGCAFGIMFCGGQTWSRLN